MGEVCGRLREVLHRTLTDDSLPSRSGALITRASLAPTHVLCGAYANFRFWVHHGHTQSASVHHLIRPHSCRLLRNTGVQLLKPTCQRHLCLLLIMLLSNTVSCWNSTRNKWPLSGKSTAPFQTWKRLYSAAEKRNAGLVRLRLFQRIKALTHREPAGGLCRSTILRSAPERGVHNDDGQSTMLRGLGFDVHDLRVYAAPYIRWLQKFESIEQGTLSTSYIEELCTTNCVSLVRDWTEVQTGGSSPSSGPSLRKACRCGGASASRWLLLLPWLTPPESARAGRTILLLQWPFSFTYAYITWIMLPSNWHYPGNAIWLLLETWARTLFSMLFFGYSA